LTEHLKNNRAALGEELADVLFWVLAMCHDHKIDLPAEFRRKLIENARKYPVEKSRGVSTKYTEL
ncbi:MAG: MazG-like family protein, partial [Tepidisphaeraceae bacterium]